MDLLNRFLNTLIEYNTADIPDYEINPYTGMSYRDYIQTIADGSAAGMEFNNGIVTMKDNNDNVLIWHILDYSCIYNGEKYKLHSVQPYTDENFINGLII